MKKILLLFTFSFSLIEFSFPQTPDWLWAKTPISAYANSGNSVATDKTGNIYVTGGFADQNITFGSITLSNPIGIWGGMFIVKYNPSGNVLWARSVPGSIGGTRITTDSLGNAYIIGAFSSDSIIFGDTVIFNNSTNNYDNDIFIIKYDSSGNQLWVKSFGGSSSDGSGTIALDKMDDIYISGFTNSALIIFDTINIVGTGSTGFIVKLNNSGNAIWAKAVPIHMKSSITIDHDNNICYTGNFSSTIAFGNITLNSNGNWDMFLAKCDRDGNFIWAKNAGGLNYEEGWDVASDSLGNIFVTGFSTSPVMYINGQPLNMPNSTSWNVFLAKYDSDGNIQWARSAGGTDDDKGENLICDNRGNVYLSGTFKSPTIIFGNDTIINSYIWDDIFLTKYNANGDVLWAKSVGGLDNDNCNDMGISPEGFIYCTGLFSSSSIIFSNDTLINPFPSDDHMFIAMLDTSCGSAIEVNNPTICVGDSVTLTAHNADNYVWNTGETNNSITVSPVSNTTYTVTGTVSGCSASATSTATVTINNTYLQPSVNITASQNPTCPFAPVTFIATPTNGGTTPAYQWFLNNLPAGTNNYIYTDSIFADGDSVYCMLTSSYLCTTENPVKSNTLGISLYPKPLAATVTQSCDTFYSDIPNGNQWYIEPSIIIPGANDSFYVPQTDGGYYVIISDSNGCHSDSSNNVYPALPVSMSIFASVMPVCPGTSISFTAIPVNGGNTPSYQWYINGIPAGSDDFIFIDSTLQNHDTISCELISSDVCSVGNPAASNEIFVSLLPKPPAPMIEQVGNFLESYTAEGNQWYMEPDSLIPGATGQFFGPSVSGYYYDIVTDTNGCKSDSSEHWHFIVSDIPVFSENNQFSIFPNPCEGCFTIYAYKNFLKDAEIRVINVSGDIMFYERISATLQQKKICVKNISKGVYAVQIENDSGISVKKIIIY